jgi:NAD(P)-dependent dehydrogenase (short-subunit alcohol dehydrogenase family)
MAIALVTGTSSGIGLATAVSLARGGHTVIATMRNLESAGDLQKIVAAEKLPVTLAALNVDDDASVENALGKVFADHGRLDVLVNNAGIGGGGSVEESSTARFREVMETNFFGALRVRTRSEDRSSILSSSRRPRLEAVDRLRHRLLLISRSAFVRANGRSFVPQSVTNAPCRARDQNSSPGKIER